jgi:hypothetical protein
VTRIKLLGAGGLLAATLLAIGLYAAAADDKKAGHHKHGALLDCAKACDDCARICDACAAHCADMLAEGKKDHRKTVRTCADCADICRAAGSVTARTGPFADTICTACAEACKRCGDACEAHKSDAMMAKCAEECRRCEKACRDMLKHLAHSDK